MNIYVWEDVYYLTNNYHDNGAVVVVAKNRENAIDLVVETANSEDKEETEKKPALIRARSY